MECVYLSAPTSPGWQSPETARFYSTRSSPFGAAFFGPPSSGYVSDADKTNTNEFGLAFEFEFEAGEILSHDYSLPARSNSFSTISFADELFRDGQVLPLKPPPRLQISVPTSPRSYGLRVRNPFAQRSTWNDGFDPFVMALEKVSEETEGRLSVHRRSRSYSPSRTSSISASVSRTMVDHDCDHGQEKGQIRTRTGTGTGTEMMGRKGSRYSRWVRSQTMVKKRSDWASMQQSPARTIIKRLCLGPNGPVKPIKQNEQTSRGSKMEKLKSVLFRYVKKESGESKQMGLSKMGYIKRLSHTFNANMKKKKESMEPKMARWLVYARGSANKL